MKAEYIIKILEAEYKDKLNEDLEDSRKENKAVITAIMKDEWKGFHHAQEKKMMQPVDTTFPSRPAYRDCRNNF